MRLFALTVLTMVAFAANSLLTRAAVSGQGMDPGLFAVVRTMAGAAMLGGIVAVRSKPKVSRSLHNRLAGAGTLALYMVGFSLAYRSLDTGVGALILFGGVQITMFAGAVFGHDRVPPGRWIGATVSIGGLAYLMWPAGTVAAIPFGGAALMTAAAVGWGLYSLIGRGARDPLAETAGNFIWAIPLVLPLLIFGASGTPMGLVLAGIAGAFTSGLGYAVWYATLPQLGASRAAVAQLSVPVIAAAGGMILLSEGASLRFLVASVLVLGGIAVSLLSNRRA